MTTNKPKRLPSEYYPKKYKGRWYHYRGDLDLFTKQGSDPIRIGEVVFCFRAGQAIAVRAASDFWRYARVAKEGFDEIFEEVSPSGAEIREGYLYRLRYTFDTANGLGVTPAVSWRTLPAGTIVRIRFFVAGGLELVVERVSRSLGDFGHTFRIENSAAGYLLEEIEEGSDYEAE